MRRILESAAAGRDVGAKKIGDYYASCMDEAAIDKLGVAMEMPEFNYAAP